VAGTSQVCRVAADRAVVRTVCNAARTVRCRYSWLPIARLYPASEHRTPLAILGSRRSARLRLHLRAAQGAHNRAALRAVAEQNAAHLI